MSYYQELQSELPALGPATPIHRLDRLGAALGVRNLYIKRDDLTLYYGNKTRHIRFILAHLKQEQVQVVQLVGSGCSNCLRIYGMALKHAGLDIKWQLESDLTGGNGKIIARMDASEAAADFVLPYDGLKAIAALGYVEAATELQEQLVELPRIDYIYLYSYDATWIGLSVGCCLCGLTPELVAIRGVGAPHGRLGTAEDKAYIDQVYGRAEELCGQQVADRHSFLLEVGGDYSAVVTQVLNVEGILLDPIYTGRAMHALMADADSLRDANILFWHTGGIFRNL